MKLSSKHSTYTKKLISLATSGYNNPMYGKHHTEEAKRKISIGNKGKKKHSKEFKEKLSKLFKGRKFSEEHKNKLSIARKEEYEKGRIAWQKGKKFTKKHRINMSKSHWSKNNKIVDAVKKKMSQSLSVAMSNIILKNNGLNPGVVSSKRGIFCSAKNKKEIRYESSYELQAYQILEQMSKVKSYDRCKFSIDYKFGNTHRKYIPDILVIYDDGTQEIIEIKPVSLICSESNAAKFKSAQRYCKLNGMNFSVWTENKLRGSC